jgi:hypothetical protein
MRIGLQYTSGVVISALGPPPSIRVRVSVVQILFANDEPQNADSSRPA